MNTAKPTEPETTFELFYRKSEASEFVFVRSVYKQETDALISAAAGDFDEEVGAKAAQICLLNLKLQLDGHDIAINSGQYRVLDGEVARSFAEIINGMFKSGKDGSKWYRTLFGDNHRFFYAQGSSNPVIVVKNDCPNRPRKILVHLVQGFGIEEKNTLETSVLQLRDIIKSLERQIRVVWTKSKRQQTGDVTTRESEHGDTTITHRRSERAWGVLEQHVRDLANPKTPWNRLYAIDRLNDKVWECAETYAYFGLQAREYMRANYNPDHNQPVITFSKPVLDAINHSLEIAKRYLPNHHKHGYNLTAFDDWGYPMLDAAGKPKFEIARILIWPTERLRSEEVYAVARLHKIYNIPLFYLAPSSVAREPQDEYILFCKPGDSEKTKPAELRGMAWDGTRRDWKQASDLHFHPLEHFFTLLKNPKLVFAIDAREMLLSGSWSSFEAEDAKASGG